VDTHPFKSTEADSAAGRHGSEDPTEPFYSPPGGVERLGRASSYLHGTGSFVKRLTEQKRNWLIAPLLVLTVAILAGTGITIGKNELRSIIHRRVEEHLRRAGQAAKGPLGRQGDADGLADEAVQNGLGFIPADLSNDEYPDIDGIFVEKLTSDDGPAALAHIQAGDVLMEFGDKQVSDSKDVAGVLTSVGPGSEVAMKVYRDGETISSRIRVADPSRGPYQPKPEPARQGFLGAGEVERTCCISGTRKWGLEIQRIIDNSPADLAGLEQGDVITEFDKHTVRTPEELSRRIRAVSPRSKVLVKFYRGATEQTAEVLMGHRSGENDSNKE
jgi:S1-C subfamily serine protease